jgi:hypothetical protein
MRALILVLVAVLSIGCANRNGVNVSPEGTAALRANQVVQALRTVITPAGASPVEQLIATKVITAEDGVKVATILRQAFVSAGDLAAVLKVADDAQSEAERHAGLLKAAVLVNAIADGLDRAALSVGTEEGRRQVADLLRLASSALLTVGSFFPVPEGA